MLSYHYISAPPQTATAVTDGSALSVDNNLMYSTELCQPPSHFPQWFPPLFVVDEVSESCAEQYMMAEKARIFRDHRAVELIMSSLDPRVYIRIGRGVCNFDSVMRDRVWETAVLAYTFAKVTPNPA